ncbi:hypothetical protein TSUD_408060 [Trifolium subterraneum]|uniref:RNase H type-1 domain-containing protein n=1 Tax=Trifolium subterraneum TaxID=3900 RepID=A0A2Z6PSZ5_TRISU|nr:hypothetical protein TSUD_408060 [Trifolium subterraneum]
MFLSLASEDFFRGSDSSSIFRALTLQTVSVRCPNDDLHEAEDDVHTFFTCVSVRASWQAVGLSSVLGSVACQQGSVAGRVFALCQNEDYATIGRVATLFWSIRHNRNDKIWNDKVSRPSQIDRWNEWFVVHKMQRRTTMCACFLNNFDELIAGLTQWQQLTLSTEEGETWALLQALNEAKGRGFDRVQFECDSQLLVEAIRTKRRDNSEFLSIVNEIILVMLSCVNFEVKFIRRQMNLVVHTLARAANS